MKIYSKKLDNMPDLDTFPGRNGIMTVDDLSVEVKITDARLRFGHLDLLITPVAGDGEQWVEEARVAMV